ncbi:MAG: hypothetical protein GTN76_15675, partial [Candidatus Aenigmarchaeota archaeon]|nr:hypothetical protein [Candidatus Aenigmarchaeota archaeon]
MTEILENLKKAVIEYDVEGAGTWARKAVEEGVDPVQAANVLTDSIRKVGEGFGRGELFITDLVMAAEVMKNAMPVLEGEIKKKGKKRETLGSIVLGTVMGDIHDIGKALVSALLTAEGFEVVDIGIDISAEKFIEAIKKNKPDILAMSALMTTTAPEQGKVIEALSKEGLRKTVKIMVGGGAITDEFSKNIGADGYGATAP